MNEKLKVMAITYLNIAEVKERLHIQFERKTDMLGPLYLAQGQVEGRPYQIRVRETSPEPSTEIMLARDSASYDLNNLLLALGITRGELFWIHPQAGGTLRRNIVDMLIANLDAPNPLIQILIGPRQVGKTTAVNHLINEWGDNAHYATADSIVGDYGPWLEQQWQKVLLMGQGSLLVIDEIQKVDQWGERIKELWDKTKSRGIRVVLLGSTSLNFYLLPNNHESLAGRFQPIYVPHWSFPETKEAFDCQLEDYNLFGGYPKAMEFSNDETKWFEYVGQSIINPIIDIDIFQLGKFKNIENLRRAFNVFCKKANSEINYTQLLKEIQSTGNTDIIKRYLEGYYDSFLLSKVSSIDDNGYEDPRKKSVLMINCPAVYTFGRGTLSKLQDDPGRFQQTVATELRRVPNKSFGFWQKNDDVGMDYYLKTADDQVFGINVEGVKKKSSTSKSYEQFRKTFKNARIVSVNPDNVKSLLEGPRAFLEVAAI